MSAKKLSGGTKGVVLVVEDNPDDVELMRMAFKKANAPCRIISVGDGGEAINYLAGQGQYEDRATFPEPLLILLDLNMPRVNGFDVLRWMKRNGRTGFPLVITLSYSQLESDVRLAYELGTSAFVAKPVDLDGSVAFVKLLINLERIAALRPRRARELRDESGSIQGAANDYPT